MTVMPSGKTAAPYEIPYAVGTDAPPNMATLSKAQGERLQVLLEARDTQLQSGGAANKVSIGGGTRTNTAFGSLSEPVKVTLPKVNAHQIIEIICTGAAFCSVETKTGTVGGRIGLSIGGNLWASAYISSGASGGALAANTPVAFASTVSSLACSAAGGSANNPWENPGINPQFPPAKFLWMPQSAATNYVIEVQAASTSGTMTCAAVTLGVNTWG